MFECEATLEIQSHTGVALDFSKESHQGVNNFVFTATFQNALFRSFVVHKKDAPSMPNFISP